MNKKAKCELCQAPEGRPVWRLRGGRWSSDGISWHNKHGVGCAPPAVLQKDARVVVLRELDGIMVCGWCYGLTLARRRIQGELF